MDRLKALIFQVLSLCLLFSCNDEDPPITYFKLNVDELYNSSAFIEGGNWVIVHDNNGTVLDYSSYSAGQNINFESATVPDKVGVTFIEITSVPGSSSIKTYLNINPGEEWTLKFPSYPNQGTDIGKLDVTIIDTEIGPKPNTQLSSAGDIDFFLYDTYHYQRAIRSNFDDLLMFVTDKNGKPLYKWFKDATAGAHSLTVADFSTFDKEINIAFPSSRDFLFIARGYPPNVDFNPRSGFVASLFWDGYFEQTVRSNVALGYLNEFASYYVSGVVNYYTPSQYNLYYEYFGTSGPESVSIIDDFDVQVVDKTYSNFSVSGQSYSSLEATWSIPNLSGPSPDVILWTVYSPKDAHRSIISVPEEISNKFQTIDFNTRLPGSTKFNKGTKSYEDEINEKFRGVNVKSFLRFSKQFPGN